MSWFQEIVQNPYIDVALLVDERGNLTATSNRSEADTRYLASMVKAAEVLARGLSAELGRGDMHMLQLSTRLGHLLVMPAGIAHYLIVLTNKSAPLELIMDYMQRVVERIPDEQPLSDDDEWNVQAIIDAVIDWLHSGGDST